MLGPPGPFVVDRDQPPLSSDDEGIVRQFHRLYYDDGLRVQTRGRSASMATRRGNARWIAG
jgi:hypothetical protein